MENNQIQNNSQPQAESQQTQAKVIPRPPYNQIVLKRSLIPFFIVFFISNLLIVSSAFGVYILLGSLIGYGFIFYPVILIVLILSVLLYLGGNYAYYRSNADIQYQLIPGYIHQMGESITDQIPGKLEVTYGGIFDKSSTVLRIDEYDRTGVTQSALARMFNYGNIHLQQIDELQETKDYLLTSVINPYEATKIIQTMIDVEVNPAQTMQPLK